MTTAVPLLHVSENAPVPCLRIEKTFIDASRMIIFSRGVPAFSIDEFRIVAFIIVDPSTKESNIYESAIVLLRTKDLCIITAVVKEDGVTDLIVESIIETALKLE